MRLAIRLLTPDLWPALEDLFGERGAVGGCWCMYCRIRQGLSREGGRGEQGGLPGDRGAGAAAGPACIRRRAARRLVPAHATRRRMPRSIARGVSCPSAGASSRHATHVPWLDRTWRLKRIDDVPVWSLSCFYVRKGCRRQGVMTELIASALQAAKRAGAPALEVYPFNADISPSASSTAMFRPSCGPGSRPLRAGTRLAPSCAMTFTQH